jgi:hypothetical protein
VLDSDLAGIQGLRKTSRPIDGYVLNVPQKFVQSENLPDWLPAGLGIAPSASYDLRLGFLVPTKEGR